jgi:hypothetical protein
MEKEVYRERFAGEVLKNPMFTEDLKVTALRCDEKRERNGNEKEN